MTGVAALWIILLLLIGGFALDRVLTSSIVAQLRQPARICAQRHDRSVRDRARRRSPLQPPARRPALHRALFGRLFPDQRRGRRHLSVAVAVGPARCASPASIRTSPSTPTTARNLPASRCGSQSATQSCRVGSPLALPGRAVARDHRPANPRAAVDPDLELRRARRRPGRACRPADRLRTVAAAPGAARSRADPVGRRRPASRRNSRPRSAR